MRAARRINEKKECEQGRSEKEVAHELRLDGETGGVRKAEGVICAPRAEESGGARQAGNIEEALQPAKSADENSRENDGFQEVGGEFFTGAQQRRDKEDGKNSEKGQPEHAGGEESASRVGGPEDREGGVQRKKSEKEEFTVGNAGERIFGIFGRGNKVYQSDRCENQKPDEREGEFEIHSGIATERK